MYKTLANLPASRPAPLMEALLKALFIAAVSFGGPAGVLTAIFPRFVFNLTAGLVCPRGTHMAFEQWNQGGGSSEFAVYCINQAANFSSDRTLLALGVAMAGYFVICLYIALAVMLIQWLIWRRREAG